MTDTDQAHDRLQSEEEIVALLAPLAAGAPGSFGLKDDCAVLAAEPGTDFVLKTDPIAAGVHFLADSDPQDVGWKALAVNVSDLAAKGAAPVAYLMALSFPEAPERAWVARFAEGLRRAQERFGCHLIGGDTDRRPGPLTIAITAIGKVPQGCTVRRDTARPGDAVFVSGTLGDAALGLLLARDAGRAAVWGLTAAMAEYLDRRYRRPEPRLGLGPALRAHASSSMDLSDGLAKDLGRMCAASGCGALVRAADVPLSEAAARAMAADPGLESEAIAGGDDYEVMTSVPEREADAFRQAARRAGVAVTRIGTITEGRAVVLEGRDGRPLEMTRTGWDHFGP